MVVGRWDLVFSVYSLWFMVFIEREREAKMWVDVNEIASLPSVARKDREAKR